MAYFAIFAVPHSREIIDFFAAFLIVFNTISCAISNILCIVAWVLNEICCRQNYINYVYMIWDLQILSCN